MRVASPWAGLHNIPIGLHNTTDSIVKYALDLRPQGPKPLQVSDIAPGLGLGFTRVLPWAPRNRPPGPWPGAGLGPGLGRAITVCAGNESIENRLSMVLNKSTNLNPPTQYRPHAKQPQPSPAPGPWARSWALGCPRGYLVLVQALGLALT